MAFYLFLVIALVLAIPTFGVSVVVFYFGWNYKQKKTKAFIKQLVYRAIVSGKPVHAPATNLSAITLALEELGSTKITEEYSSEELTRTMWTTVQPTTKPNPIAIEIQIVAMKEMTVTATST